MCCDERTLLNGVCFKFSQNPSGEERSTEGIPSSREGAATSAVGSQEKSHERNSAEATGYDYSHASRCVQLLL